MAGPRFEDEYLSVTSADVFGYARVLKMARPRHPAYTDALVDMAVEVTGYTEEICREQILGA